MARTGVYLYMFNSTSLEIIAVIIIVLAVVRPNKINLKIFGIFTIEAERKESDKKLEEKNKKHDKEKED